LPSEGRSNWERDIKTDGKWVKRRIARVRLGHSSDWFLDQHDGHRRYLPSDVNEQVATAVFWLLAGNPVSRHAAAVLD
jgi:hypothetical protein